MEDRAAAHLELTVDRPAWAPSWATATEMETLSRTARCEVCGKIEKGLIRWTAYAVITCREHAVNKLDRLTATEVRKPKPRPAWLPDDNP